MALSEILLVGLNHRQASVEVRERLAFEAGEAASFLEAQVRSGHLAGGVLLSTCNRVELYADAAPGADPAVLQGALLQSKGLPPAEAGLFYTHRGAEALRHAFRVASGLDSMILGEPQILGQLKDAYFLARDRDLVSTPLNLMFQKTFHVAKKVRTETGIGERPVTISYAAFNLAANIFENFLEKAVLLLGAGEMSRIVATHFYEAGVGKVLVSNRTAARAEEFARLFGARAIPWEDFPGALKDCDIVICCTGAPRPILGRDVLERAMAARRWSPMFVIDIAVPRDVDPEAASIDGLYLYDIDDLQQVADEGLAERQRKAELAEGQIAEEVELYARFLANQELSGLIAGVVSWAGSVQERELEEAFRRLEGLSEKQREVVRNTVRRVVHKILHSPITEVKHLVVEEGDTRALDHFQRLFPSRGRGPDGERANKEAP